MNDVHRMGLALVKISMSIVLKMDHGNLSRMCCRGNKREAGQKCRNDDEEFDHVSLN